MPSPMKMTKAVHAHVEGDDSTRPGLNIYRAFTVLSYLLVLFLQVTASFFKFSESLPTIWAVNEMNPTMYSLEEVSVLIYWFGLNLAQTVYMYELCTDNDFLFGTVELVGPHFILHNFLHSLWICSWATSQFWVGEIFLALNMIHLSSLYFSTSPHTLPAIHCLVAAGPLVWTTFAIFMNTGAMLYAHGKSSGGTGILPLWAFAACGALPTFFRQDYIFGYCFVLLSASLGLQQLKLSHTQSGVTHDFQMILAFYATYQLFLTNSAVAILHFLGLEIYLRPTGETVSSDEESPAPDSQRPLNEIDLESQPPLKEDDLESQFPLNELDLESQRPLKEDDPDFLPDYRNYDYAHGGCSRVTMTRFPF